MNTIAVILSPPLVFNAGNAEWYLQSLKYPYEEWDKLATSLKMSSFVGEIRANNQEVFGRFQALITKWVRTRGPDVSWDQLIDGLVRSGQKETATLLAKEVGVTPPGTTFPRA